MRSIRKVLVIGGHGVLGRPVVRRLVKEGFHVRAMARNVKRAGELLPRAVQVVGGDLRKVETIVNASRGTDAVYLNLATYDHEAGFRPELDGTHHVIEALKSSKIMPITKISAMGTAKNSSWPDAFQKYQAEEAIKASGHPFLIFRPTAFMESLPLFIRQKFLLYFGRQPHPRYWIAGDDFGRQVASALARGDFQNRIFNVQGCEPLTLKEAGLRFARAYDSRLKVLSIPVWILRIAVLLRVARSDVVKVMEYTGSTPEPQQSEETWKELGRPRMTIEDYVDYISETGDLPTKQAS